jgi:hypothetical protein
MVNPAAGVDRPPREVDEPLPSPALDVRAPEVTLFRAVDLEVPPGLGIAGDEVDRLGLALEAGVNVGVPAPGSAGWVGAGDPHFHQNEHLRFF